MKSGLPALLSLLLITILHCREADPSQPTVPPTSPSTVDYSESDYQDVRLPDSLLYDKILGLLVGSAIGDAMGAPTEMWSQPAISDEYGHVDSLDMVLREPSPEGPWAFNLPPGAGTDDTRWKNLMVDYSLTEHDARSNSRPLTFSGQRFAHYLNERYRRRVEALKDVSGLEPEPLEDAMRRVAWLQEWATVARAYAEGDVDDYRNALSRFYGGEMSCAGMLYSPVFGAVYPGRPEAAYRAAYETSLFDLGYARDISGLTAALTAIAFQPDVTPDDFLKVVREVDPENFFRSRLIGRVAYRLFQQARSIVRVAERLTPEEARAMDFRLPDRYPYDSLTYARTLKAYALLDEAKQDVPFHAAEIYLITITSLLFTEYQFQPAMEFIVNYGRDNDTVAAVAGSIIGALRGYGQLPAEQRATVIRVNRELLDIDLEQQAQRLTQAVLDRRQLETNDALQ
ncbi:ADP-ribosylglycohydrolase family protein [Neolewinella litorea]|uniref:ADP-ribosylglycohydrolase family protein n=1 Tax=Neolewinella litorea TaxID=2562452 RepID=A0A4S4NJL0_9BACT|nr:ADP-ribosylglycohydrolase family protein [Neolewinella litorea]THH39994.1 ADP-ribosylglycohydrolase family protein [Neolewinella litorea]